MPSLPSFILFDLDDTILDYTASGRRCWQGLCRIYGPRLGLEPEQLLAALQQVSHWYWSDPQRHCLGRMDLKSSRRQILRQTLDRLGLDCYDLGQEMADAFTIQREEVVAPFPGAIAALRDFQEQGVRMALVTNGTSESQRNKIRRFDLANYFETILIEGKFGVGKPDLGVFQHALDQLGAPPKQAWMVGDDLERDIQPAWQLGLGTVWMDCEGSGLPADSQVRPEWSVRTLAELPSLFG
jgi:putative hydrolase of the HAD superfamily